MAFTLLAPHFKKIEAYFASFIVLDFDIVWFCSALTANKPVLLSRKQLVRAYCSNVYTVISGQFGFSCSHSFLWKNLPDQKWKLCWDWRYPAHYSWNWGCKFVIMWLVTWFWTLQVGSSVLLKFLGYLEIKISRNFEDA